MPTRLVQFSLKAVSATCWLLAGCVHVADCATGSGAATAQAHLHDLPVSVVLWAAWRSM